MSTMTCWRATQIFVGEIWLIFQKKSFFKTKNCRRRRVVPRPRDQFFRQRADQPRGLWCSSRIIFFPCKTGSITITFTTLLSFQETRHIFKLCAFRSLCCYKPYSRRWSKSYTKTFLCTGRDSNGFLNSLRNRPIKFSTFLKGKFICLPSHNHG